MMIPAVQFLDTNLLILSGYGNKLGVSHPSFPEWEGIDCRNELITVRQKFDLSVKPLDRLRIQFEIIVTQSQEKVFGCIGLGYQMISLVCSSLEI
jgi:hypothetical protein